MRLMNKDRPGREERLTFSDTNQILSPGRDVTPSPGEGGIVIQHRARGRDVNGRGGRTRW